VKNKSILIADDHEIVRYGLRQWITEIAPGCRVREAESYEELRNILAKQEFTHLILDLQLHGISMFEKFPFIRNGYPDLYIMIYSMRNGMRCASSLLDMGANGFLSKASTEADTVIALRHFLRYNGYVKEEPGQDMFVETPVPENAKDIFQRLSPRERQMACLFLKGDTAKQIQYALRLKSSTVSTIKSRILEKLNVSSITELIRLAYDHQLI
jgi:DNA-binding NarL/FixJ family response regulator